MTAASATAGHLGDPSQARDAFDRSVADLLRFTGEPAETDDPAAEPPSSEAARTPARTPARSQ